MNELENDPMLSVTAHRVAELGRRVDLDLQHKTRLREELLRRHQELSVATTQRATGTLWSRFSGLKRLTLVAPAALAVATALSIILSALQISGRQSTQVAEAARITQALVQSVPTLTSWSVQVTFDQVRDNSVSGSSCSVRLTSEQRLYIRGDHAYLYSGGIWYQVTPNQASRCNLPDWQWAFAQLPAGLAHRKLAIVQGKPVDGQTTDVISYTAVVSTRNRSRVVVSAMVDRKTGLVRRLTRTTYESGKLVERDSADYRYERSS